MTERWLYRLIQRVDREALEEELEMCVVGRSRAEHNKNTRRRRRAAAIRTQQKPQKWIGHDCVYWAASHGQISWKPRKTLKKRSEFSHFSLEEEEEEDCDMLAPRSAHRRKMSAVQGRESYVCALDTATLECHSLRTAAREKAVRREGPRTHWLRHFSALPIAHGHYTLTFLTGFGNRYCRAIGGIPRSCCR